MLREPRPHHDPYQEYEEPDEPEPSEIEAARQEAFDQWEREQMDEEAKMLPMEWSDWPQKALRAP